MKKSQFNTGFTFIELLIGMAIMGVIMVALTSFFGQGAKTSAQSSSRAQLQQELLNAQQLISGKLKEAWYVYPPTTAASRVLSSEPLTQNPITTGTNNWDTNQPTPSHPLLSMILPPLSPGAGCAPGSITNEGGCYRFIAYYPVKRLTWINNTASTSWRNPGPDTANDNTWILAEYRRSMPASFTAGTFPPAAPPTIPLGGVSNLLSDYIAPTIVTTGLTTTTNVYTMFTYTTATAANGVVYVTGIQINLASTRITGGPAVRIPATGTYQVAVYPTNLGKIPTN